MASAFFREDRRQWFASFSGVHAGGSRYRVIRVPADQIRSARTAKRDATAFAKSCDQFCRLLEQNPSADIADRAHKLGAITAEQLAAALVNAPILSTLPREPAVPTIAAAFRAHPSTQREPGDAAARYVRCLSEFAAWSSATHLHDLTTDLALRWIQHLRAQGYADESRRHYMVPLRRAASMGARLHGVPDQISGLRLDRRDGSQRTITVWTLSQLAQALANSAGRLRALITLGACIGLRPSEIARLTVADLTGDVLRVATTARKNDASRRDLPLPAIVVPWLDAVTYDHDSTRRAASEPLIRPDRQRRPGAAYTADGFSQWSRPDLAALATRLHLPVLQPKELRKTFATIASEILPARDVERYLGHRTLLSGAVTARHYLAGYQVADLRPAAQAIDQSLRKSAAMMTH